ncbi:MAG TPA: hypothetical protein VG838_08695 [Opitutaceae bacterium]|nr:hypothetical protein [Opitutaceae bacterium]
MQETAKKSEKSTPVAPRKDQSPRTITEEFGEKFANFVLPPQPPAKKDQDKGPPPIPEELKKQFVNPATPISLFPPRPAPAKAPPPVPPTYYLPSFRIIHCELVAGPQTGNIETPLIGIVLENQFNIDPDGVARLVIPAGVEVHGNGKPSPIRDRIDGNGKWSFVWRTNDENNGMELTVSALALNRDYDQEKRIYGDLEKSPGIVGRRFESFSDKAIEEALLDSVAAVTRSLKSYTAVLNPLTSQVVNEQKPTIGNALLEGAGAGTDRLAQMIDDIRKEIDEKGYYIAILPGKEFYLYTKEPVDLRKARRPQPLAASEKSAPSQEGGGAAEALLPDTAGSRAGSP